ncbi:hypothetical protein [Vibrio mexicanus]|uniref:hypothetical protein n=1 Tax=Vibrio mexicanus TaxID=1004326 RepID=UPI00063C007C|nr:hypothetical protein [Vibrio mexicanus]
MTNQFENVVQQVTEQIEDSEIKNLIAGAFKSSIDKQRESIEMLMVAHQEGQIDDDTLEIEFDREKLITEAEMLTWQITTKAEVQKVVNKAFHLLKEAVT